MTYKINYEEADQELYDIYLASRFSRRKQLAGYAKTLRRHGYSVNCRWLTDPRHRIRATPEQIGFNNMLAQHDMEDIKRCGTFVIFIDDVPGSRGGMYVELGLAIAYKKHIILVGRRTNVFTFIPEVNHCLTWEEARELIYTDPEI